MRLGFLGLVCFSLLSFAGCVNSDIYSIETTKYDPDLHLANLTLDNMQIDSLLDRLVESEKYSPEIKECIASPEIHNVLKEIIHNSLVYNIDELDEKEVSQFINYYEENSRNLAKFNDLVLKIIDNNLQIQFDKLPLVVNFFNELDESEFETFLEIEKLPDSKFKDSTLFIYSNNINITQLQNFLTLQRENVEIICAEFE